MMTKCPLIKSRKKSSAPLPKLQGRTLATIFAFGMGLLMATSLAWKVDFAQHMAHQAVQFNPAAVIAPTDAPTAEFDETPFQMPLLAGNN